MKPHLNPASAVPLYHQIAEALLYQIATGRLAPGAKLPTLKRAAEDWGVNLHTVGRAYHELAARGLIESRGRSGTRVIRSTRSTSSESSSEIPIAGFLARIVREAQEKHGLYASDLARMLRNWPGPSTESRPTVHVVECSTQQCSEHGREIEGRWAVRAVPWLLGNESEPPPGPVVATYFHYHEILRSWPRRRREVRFVTIRPDPDLPHRIPAGDPETRRSVFLCEFDEPKAVNTIAELSLILPPETYDLQARVVDRGGELLQDGDSTDPVIFPPRVWAALSDEERGHPRSVHLRFFIDPAELEALGGELGWRRSFPESAA